MHNVQWIFSGIGVFVLTLVVATLAKRRAHAGASVSALPPATALPEPSPKTPASAKTYREARRVELGSFADFDFPAWKVGVHLSEIRMAKKKYSEVEEPFAVVGIRHHAMWACKRVTTIDDGFLFLMPSAVLEQDDGVVAFSLQGEHYWFFVRITVTHINHHSGWADFELAGFASDRYR